MGRIIGIDLGTTNTVTAIYDLEKRGARIVFPSPNNAATPSIVAIDKKGRWIVGETARNQQVTNPTGTVYSVKRFMGRRHREVASEEKLVPYEITGKPGDFVKIGIGRRRFTPQEVSAQVLRHVKQTAEAQLGEPVVGAIITVPAYFNDAQRQATRDAGRIAGLDVKRIINEPTAAAVAYGLERYGQQCIVVFDLGGGTFDLSVMQINSGSFKVLAVHGNTHLGGDDFDQRILDLVAGDFLRRERIDVRRDPMSLQRLKQAAQEAKATLSVRTEAKVSLPFICVDASGPKHLEYTLTRERFESVCSDLFDNLTACCNQVMQEAGLKAKDVDEVVLVGGGTRIPRVQEVAKRVFGLEQLNKSINPDEVVALGAAVVGAVVKGELKNVSLMDVTSHGFGVEAAEGRTELLLDKNTPIPITVKKVFSTPADNQTSVPINVLEGESDIAVENRPLGTFRLTGIRRAPRGVPRIEVQFSIDADGILEVTARDLETGHEQAITVTGSGGLSDAEIDRMKKPQQRAISEAERHNEQIELRNHAEKVYSDMRKWTEYNAQMISQKGLMQLAAALDKLRKKIEKDDAQGMRAALKKLGDIQATYRKAG